MSVRAVVYALVFTFFYWVFYAFSVLFFMGVFFFAALFFLYVICLLTPTAFPFLTLVVQQYYSINDET